MQSATTTATTIRPKASPSSWESTNSKEKAPSLTLKDTKVANDEATPPTKVTTSGKTGGFYDQQTLWEQELHRYHPSFWTLVRVISLIGFPYLMSAIGSFFWPLVVEFAEANGLKVARVAQAAIALVGGSAFVAHNAFFAAIYYFNIPSFDQYRVDDKPWHWDMLGVSGWREMLRNTILQILFNFIAVNAPVMYLISRRWGGLPFRMDATSIPSGGEIFWQLLFCTVIEDFCFHHSHQLLHTKQLYWIHKVHHRYHAPISIAAVYAHPLETVFGNIFPFVSGPFLLQYRMHGWAFCIWGIFRLAASLENHSGYEFPWSMFQAIPFKAPTEYHDFHHNRNQGTYSGVLRFWDCVYGTNKHYFEWVRAGRPDTFKTQKFKEQKQK
ncbi:Methylsterol monooxygenase 1 [Seminavis robusta]|uniref:Methylsterol monooxygenase 1 n=1 Tax=Seminavis robusta TaxID=568900 RepID=A0A9N8ETG9_9STRA|nr:Methylsterol monooxygenase 1 [Seminavis robusta]|eukprot:Sro1771_g296590.1 Methylsterol monooxygenase 1 (383) ;mRNA; f:1342-2490